MFKLFWKLLYFGISMLEILLQIMKNQTCILAPKLLQCVTSFFLYFCLNLMQRKVNQYLSELLQIFIWNFNIFYIAYIKKSSCVSIRSW
jgi:hypothetical protein